MSIFLGDLKENILRIYLRCMLDASICAYSLLSILRSSIPICFADWPNKKSHECGILSLVTSRRIELLFPGWEPDFLTVRRWGHVNVWWCGSQFTDKTSLLGKFWCHIKPSPLPQVESSQLGDPLFLRQTTQYTGWNCHLYYHINRGESRLWAYAGWSYRPLLCRLE